MKYKVTYLREVVSFISKGIAPKYVEKDSIDSVRVVNQRCNRNNRISLQNSRLNNLKMRNVPKIKYLHKGDILINSTGVGTAGRVAQIKENFDKPVTFDGHMILIRGNSQIDSLFLGYYLEKNQRVIEQFAEGSTGQTEINRERLLDELVIKFPTSVDEQRRLAEKFRLLDRKIDLNNQINDNLLELIKASFNKIVIDKSKEETISKIFRVYSGFAFNKNDWADDGKPIIKIKDINNMTINLENLSKVNNLDKLKRAEKYYITSGEIVIALTGATLGKFGIVPYNFKGYVNQRVGLIFPKLSEVSVLGILLQKDIMNRIISLGHGSAQPNISPTTINKLIVNIDIKSCKKFDKTFAPIYQEIIYNLYEKQLLQNIKQELMLKLF